MRPRIVALITAAALIGSGLVAASAASLGSLSSAIFAASGPVAYPQAVRSASNLTLSSAGSPATVSGLTLTVTGADLPSLNGQSVTIALLGAGGAQVQQLTATLVSGGNLTLGGGQATVTLPISGSPLLSSFESWAVFIGGVQALGPMADPNLRVITTGQGTFTVPVTPINWQALLVTAGTNRRSSSVASTAATTDRSAAITIKSAARNGNSPATWAGGPQLRCGPFWGTPPSQYLEER